MKIKVTFSEVVEADSVDDAYMKIIDHVDHLVKVALRMEYLTDAYPNTVDDSDKMPNKIIYKRCNTKLTDINGFTFEELGQHSGYGEGSVDNRESIQDYVDQ